VTEPDDVLLGRAEIERAFTALGERLVRRGVVADVFVVGGAAMALAYDAARVTRDVDAVFKPHGIVLDEARKVADDLGLPYWWLNQQASVYISGKEDASKRRVFDHPGLRVMAASPAHVFAMNGMRKQGSLFPTQQGIPLAKDAWMMSIGLGLVIDDLTDRPGPKD